VIRSVVCLFGRGTIGLMDTSRCVLVVFVGLGFSLAVSCATSVLLLGAVGSVSFYFG
jgi:hypothetical protein